MRKYRLLSLLILVLFAYSCNSWLDVKPEDELDESDMFASGDGYRHALNGIYYGMSGQTLYGEDLTWGLVDVFGRTYTTYSVYGSGNRALAMFYYGVYLNNWDNDQLEPEIESIWESAYKMVANCNNLIQNISKEDSDKFAYKEREQKMIWGEALALRAFIQFDMLRLFAASPAMNPGATKYIPYISEYPSYVSIPLTVDSCLNSTIRDLKAARELLWKADSATTFTAQRRFETSSSDDDFFLDHKRGYRLNYHAATAIL
ncbi:MAG: RagB/SusD family nutrient uptake outer membrane protein, partial [Butyricimonas faecihominis]